MTSIIFCLAFFG